MFYETIKNNVRKSFKGLSCVIYTIVKNCVCIDYLACKSKQLSELPVDSAGVSKHGDKRFDKILGIGLTDFLMNLMFCRGLLKHKIMLSYLKDVGLLFIKSIYH